MVEGRANFPLGGVSRFSADNNSSNAAGTSREKNSQGTEYFAQEKKDDEENKEFKESEFVDRSAQLNASLNSLAMMNVAGIMKKNNPKNPAPTKKE
ncbi:MAG: hypothetical protein PHV68_07060 [Candidatus Gastranaerophilales bacterium]|nr:hypothetical protein [Candidatus Gastranaerophilales bacterium]